MMCQQQWFEISLNFRVVVHSDQIVDEKTLNTIFSNRLKESDGIRYSWLSRAISILINDQVKHIVFDMTKDENSKTWCFLKGEVR